MQMKVEFKYHKVADKKKHKLPEIIHDVEHMGLTDYEAFMYIENKAGEIHYIASSMIATVSGTPKPPAVKLVD